MGRLIEVQVAPDSPTSLTVAVGDLLQFAASGGHVRRSPDVVEMVGPFLSAVVGSDGSILAPAGAPSTVFFLAQRPGHATIDVVTGDPWHQPQTTVFHISVGP